MNAQQWRAAGGEAGEAQRPGFGILRVYTRSQCAPIVTRETRASFFALLSSYKREPPEISLTGASSKRRTGINPCTRVWVL
jgi:hypothetical protein